MKKMQQIGPKGERGVRGRGPVDANKTNKCG